MYTSEMFERASNLFDSLLGEIPEILTLELDCCRPRVIVTGFEHEDFDSLSLACNDEHAVCGALLRDGELQIIYDYDIDTKDFFSMIDIIAEIDYLFNM